MIGSWSLNGPKRVKPRPNFTISAVAVLFAAQTFAPDSAVYPFYMCLLAWGSALWITWCGVKAKSLLSLTAIPISLFWLVPVLGGTWFSKVGIEFLLTHGALALVWALCAYGFLATEKPAK